MSTQTDSKRIRNKKRILSVTIRRMIDESPDTSWLGEYSNRPANEYAIDRAHSEDCASARPDVQSAKQTLEHVQQTIGDLYNVVISHEYMATNSEHETEREALDEAYDEVGELLDEVDACDCGEHGDMGRGEYRYFNPSFNYVTKDGRPAAGHTPEDVRNYTRQDYERMESANRGDWCFIGIRAEAQVQVTGDLTQDIRSGGLWGIESDSDRSYIEVTIREELASLKTELLALGFSTRAIATAFKDVQEKAD